MTSEESRRRKTKSQYDVLFVPIEQSGKTKRYRVTALRLWLLGGISFFLIVALTLVTLVYTPFAMYVPIPNPELEKRYGREIAETQQRLKTLAEDILLLRDYNMQLRKALGENGARDTAATAKDETISANREPGLALRTESADARSNQQPRSTEEYGDFDLAASHFNVVVSSNEGFRAAFPLLAPTEGFVTQIFDPTRKHFGIDYAAKRGTPVYAATDGYIVFAEWTYDDGNMLIISHGGGYLTVYKHNQALMKNAHTFVKRGELIALLGTSGKTSTGPHLHFEVWKDGIPQDPNEFLLTPAKIQ
jgi:murein DD-endopeptidase MepM/ murein hydrolase activator NlpD